MSRFTPSANANGCPVYNQYFTRTKYDTDYVATDVRQSTRPLNFALDPNYAERCNRCLPTEVGWISKQGISYDASRPMVDTESDLFNLNRILTKNQCKYQPKCKKGQCMGVMNWAECDKCQPSLYHFPMCDIRNEYTRLSNPVSTLKETGSNRFQPLCLDPQDQTRWEHPGEVGINYRMVAKDNHVPCIPHPIDQTLALPKGGDLPCTLTHPVCNAPIMALNRYQAELATLPLKPYIYDK